MSSLTSRTPLRNSVLEVKSHIIAAISSGMAVFMLFFLLLVVIFSSAITDQQSLLPALLIIGGLLLVSLLVLGLNYLGHVILASWLFLGGFSLLIMLSMFQMPSATSAAPYFLGVSVVLCGILLRPYIAFVAAFLGTLATALMGTQLPAQPNAPGIPTWFVTALIPGTLLFLLAIVAWLYGAETARMLDNLRGITKETREGVDILGASASEILAVTAQVAARTTETAAAISETTATADEVRQAADLSADKAKYVSEISQKAIQIGMTGTKSMDDTALVIKRIQEQMELIADSIVRLSEQSQAIGEIIATVTDLAEQSNLLAVNAAIEAAKAGEHGRGFSVVAQEVRSLAEQSKQSTLQIRTILNDIQKATSSAVMATEQGGRAVSAGVKQSQEAGESIRQLAEVVTESAQAATQIAASSQQQLVGMNQVAQAMENINEAGSQNAASTRQAEIIARDLHDLGQRLKHLVEQYNL